MNAMGSNSSLLNLFMSLGLSPESTAAAVGSGSEEGGLFATLMADLGAAGTGIHGLTAGVEGENGQSSLLNGLSLAAQSLPLTDQSLPLSGMALPPEEESALAEIPAINLTGLPAEALSDSDDLKALLQQISQGQQPMPVRDVITEDPAEADVGDSSTALATSFSRPLIDEVSEEDDTAAEEPDASNPLLLAAAPVAAVPAGQEQSKISVMTERGGRALEKGGLNSNSLISDAGTDSSADDSLGSDEGSDFYMPGNDKPVKDAPVVTHQTQSALLTPVMQKGDDAQLALMARTGDQSSEIQLPDGVDEFTESDAENTLEKFSKHDRLTAARDRLRFGEDTREWGSNLGGRIMTMVANGIQEARIQLDPPELGSMEIKLHIHQDQTSVQIHVQNPQVKEVLEANASRLRESLAQQGMALNDFDVSSQSGSSGQEMADRSGQEGNGSGYSSGQGGDDDQHGEELSQPASVARSSTSLLDTFV